MIPRNEDVEADKAIMQQLLNQDHQPTMDDIQSYFHGHRLEYFHYLLFLCVRDKMFKDRDVPQVQG